MDLHEVGEAVPLGADPSSLARIMVQLVVDALGEVLLGWVSPSLERVVVGEPLEQVFVALLVRIGDRVGDGKRMITGVVEHAVQLSLRRAAVTGLSGHV